ncbi:MAG: patatin-like phospholipase family protein [Betaproteobacteria bacterium]|nr:patatin-like phospholipase family protein [Betaproteobacteria bacterium]
MASARPQDRRLALVLQGGGALGAYQAGVYQALEEHDLAPDWVAGTSIGAINGALIAGNAPARRLPRLREFWEAVSRPGYWPPANVPGEWRLIAGMASALQAVMTGQPGFFTPRFAPPLFVGSGDSAKNASYYDTDPLRELLSRLVDFTALNQGAIRFSLGAVHVRSGRLRYFDSRFQEIRLEHVMASGALPPGFPAVEVDGELWWDGGIYSNTPLEVVLDDYPRRSTLCFMVDLFNSVGEEPRSIPEVETRHKDITYATRSRQHIETYAKVHNLRNAVSALYDRMPDGLRDDAEVKSWAALGCRTSMEIVHLGYPDRPGELSLKDVDFSSAAIAERWGKGYRDALRAIERAPWREPVPPHVGVVVHEVPQE